MFSIQTVIALNYKTLSSSKCMKNICLICGKDEGSFRQNYNCEVDVQWFSVGLVLDGCISHVYLQLSKKNLKIQIGFVDCAQINVLLSKINSYKHN